MGSGKTQRKLTWIFLLLLVLSALACARQNKTTIPRVAQGHIQWLEKQSMLGASHGITSQVSASERMWQNAATPSKRELLLTAAPNWLSISPHLIKAPPGHFFSTLTTSPLLDILTTSAIGGLFLSPTGERGDVWTNTGDTSPISPCGENVSALRFDAQLGTDRDFELLTKRLDTHNIQLGGKLVPLATGLGPDFMLQARNVSRFEGLYAMLNVPKEYWDKMPPNEGEWACRQLNAIQRQYLAENGIIPLQLMRDTQTWASPGGWAITGEVRGMDGNLRRWAYRYAHTTLRPVLSLQDPSGLARRIASAAIIRHTGLQRQVLAGVSMEPQLGLEAGTYEFALAPGLNAIEQLGLEIHRYGGWSLQTDAFPPAMWPKLLSDGIDFCADHTTQIASIAALEKDNALPLVVHLSGTLKQQIPHQRLARGLMEDADTGKVRTLAGQVELILKKQSSEKGIANVGETLLLLLGIRAGLPGLCFVSLEDLTGSTALEPAPLWDGEQTSCLLGPLAQQWRNNTSVASQIVALLQKRKEYGLAMASLIQATHFADGGIALVNALPQGGYWVTVANFSREHIAGKISLPEPGLAVKDILGGSHLPVVGRQLEVKLAPRGIRHMVLAKR